MPAHGTQRVDVIKEVPNRRRNKNKKFEMKTAIPLPACVVVMDHLSPLQRNFEIEEQKKVNEERTTVIPQTNKQNKSKNEEQGQLC